MKSYPLKITTPAGALFEGNAIQLSVRALDGELAVLAGHIPMVTALKAGECRVYFEDGSMKKADCVSGLLSVKREGVSLLSSSFQWKE